jgi:long-chain acyl-CoA synthetase
MSAGILFATLAERAPDEVVLQGATKTWCAAELRSEVEDLAAWLAGTRVLAVLADNGPAWVIADLAALRAGAVHLPLPGFFSQPQLAHALEQSAADTLLTDQPARIAELDLGFVTNGEWNGLTRMQRSVPAVFLPTGTAKISFTSGSTGAPKGVCLGAAGLMATARALVDRLANLPIDRHLAVLPLSLLLENCAGIYAPLLRGARDLSARSVLAGLARYGWVRLRPRCSVPFAQRLPNSLILVPELLKAVGNIPGDHETTCAIGTPLRRRRRCPRLSGSAFSGTCTGSAGLSGLWADRVWFGRQPQPPRRRRRSVSDVHSITSRAHRRR